MVTGWSQPGGMKRTLVDTRYPGEARFDGQLASTSVREEPGARTLNQRVAGSIPARPIKRINGSRGPLLVG